MTDDPTDLQSDIAANLAAVRARIAHAAAANRRPAGDIRLVAVSKTFGLDEIRAAIAAGQRDFGENRVQEALPKIEALANEPIHWHLIGHLQSNKAKKAVAFDAIHSIDSLEILAKVDEAAAAAGRAVDVLLQIDLAGESTKFGAPPAALPALLEAAGRCQSARLRGLMTLPPAAEHPEEARRYFAQLRELRERHLSRVDRPEMLADLSMGMSHDFEVAIEEGATLVRIGSGIFGDRGV